MATLGDLNPSLYQKSQLQLDNEARAGVTSGTPNASNNPTLNNTPGSQNIGNPTGIIESNAGYTTMSGQKTASNSQLEATRQNIGALSTPAPGVGKPPELPTYYNVDAPGKFETRVQDRAPEQNQGLYYNNSTGQTNNPSYKAPTFTQRNNVSSSDVLGGKTPQAAGVANVNPVMTNKLQTLQNDYATIGTDAYIQGDPQLQAYIRDGNYQALWGELASRKQGIKAQMDAMSGSDAYKQEQNDAAAQAAALSDKGQSENAQAVGSFNAGDPLLQGGSPTGDPRYDAMLGNSASLYDDTKQFAEDVYQSSQEATRMGLINSIMKTNISDLGYNKQQLQGLTTAQLVDLAQSDGVTMSQKIKDQLTANGKLQIENLKLEREQGLADTEMTKRQIERVFNRSIDEREQFNTQQDTKLRRMLGSFGGGEDLAGNMAVMHAQEQGKRALEDLNGDFGDRMDSLGRQATSIRQGYTNQIMGVQNDMTAAIENAYTNLMGKVDGYIQQGITDKKELASSILGAKKDYVNSYADITDKAANYQQKLNENLFNQMMQLRQAQTQEDQNMSASYGFMFKNGKPILDQQGNRVPTLDGMRFDNEMDRTLSEQQGIVYKGGQPMLDSKGQPIQTFDAQKFFTSEQNAMNRFNTGEENAMSRFYTGEQNQNDRFNLGEQNAMTRFNMGENNEMNRFNQTMSMNLDKQTADLFANGITMGRIDPQTGMVKGQSGIFSANGSKYTPFVSGDAIRADIQKGPNDTLQAWSSLREQCGEFVNDLLGKKVMGDGFLDKMGKVTSKIPQIGSAFVQATSNQYGHTGFVEKVNYNAQGIPDSMEIIDSNAKGSGKVERATIKISYDENGNPRYTRNGQKADIRGYTDSILGKTASTPTQKMGLSPSGRVMMQDTGGGGDNGASAIAQDIMSPFSSQRLSDVPDKMKASVSSELTRLREQAFASGDIGGVVKSSGGGEKLTDTVATKLSQAREVKNSLGDVERLVAGVNTDPILGMIRSNNPYDVQAKQLDAAIVALVPGLARGIFGEVGVLTDKDVARYAGIIPNINTAAGAKQLLLTAINDKVNRSINTTLDTYARAGYDVSRFGSLLDQQSNSGGQNTLYDNYISSLGY